MLKRILVPLDDSPYSKAAMLHASRMASRTGAEITCLAVIDKPGIEHREPVPAGGQEFLEHKHKKLLEQAREKSEHMLENFSTTIRELGEHTTNQLTLTGVPSEVIIKESHRHDILVMGQKSSYRCTSEARPFQTLEKTARAVPRPMIVVPETLPENSSGILMAADGSDVFSRAMQMYLMMGLTGGRKIKVLSVNKVLSRAQANCEEAGSYLESHGMEFETLPIQSTQRPRDFILAYLKTNTPDVMIMGAYGDSLLKEFFYGSLTEKIIENSPVPLFICH